MPNNEALQNLKQFNFVSSDVGLVIVREYKRERASRYTLKYVKTDDSLQMKLRGIVSRQVQQANTIEDYSFDCPEPEEDQVRTISSVGTDFNVILDRLSDLDPEQDTIEGLDELVSAKAYIIVFRDQAGIKVAAFRTLPENWKLRKSKGLIPLLFKENRFEDLEDDNIFSISNSVDFIYFQDLLFVLSKSGFERGLNFREGLLSRADELYAEAAQLRIFVNLDLLRDRVGNNLRYLRKLAIILDLGHFRESSFLSRMESLSTEKGWGVEFNGGQILLTEGTLDVVLTILQNKRLHSEITYDDFDVDHATPV